MAIIKKKFLPKHPAIHPHPVIHPHPGHHPGHHPHHNGHHEHHQNPQGTSYHGAGYSPSPEQMNNIQAFNKEKIYTQGYRFTQNGTGSNSQTVQLAAPGRFLVGINITPVSAGDVSDMQATLNVNSLIGLNQVSFSLLNPNFTLGFLYFPVPTPLIGNDSIIFSYIKNNAGNVTFYMQLLYNPQNPQ
jgi:hypothetical protein